MSYRIGSFMGLCGSDQCRFEPGDNHSLRCCFVNCAFVCAQQFSID